jgi:small-conductance mechanosensitive channel
MISKFTDSWLALNFYHLMATAFLIIVFVVFTKKIRSKIEKNLKLTDIIKAQNIKFYSNDLLFALIIFVMILWFSPIQHFVITFLTLAAVFVSKGLIIKFTGGFLIHLNGHFKVCDRIEVNNIRFFFDEKT